jgi:hypothetical protein
MRCRPSSSTILKVRPLTQIANLEELDEIISVDHPRVVENYREAHDLATGRTRSQSTTEGLRKAMVHYRSLFDELLQDTSIERKEARA